MKSTKWFALASALITPLMAGNRLFAQTWTPAIAPITNWSAVVSSADGSRWFAAAGATYAVPVFADPNFNSPIYCSTDSGLTWQPTTAPYITWSSIACSADGTHVVAASSSGPIYVSADSGATWTLTSAPSKYWYSIASSAAGDKLVAATENFIFTSADYGNTWVSNNVPAKIWEQVASSANGNILFAFEIGYYNLQIKGSIYVSTNSGLTWAPTSAPQLEWRSLACSADGTKVVAAPIQDLSFNPAPLYLSSDSGISWTSNATVTGYWNAIASSADGKKLAGTSAYSIYSSVDGGITWNLNNAPHIYWNGAGSCADGSKSVVLSTAAGNGQLYHTQSMPQPCLLVTGFDGSMTVSWVVPSTNFVLQESFDLMSWRDLTNVPTLNLNNLQQQITVGTDNGSGFYRLIAR